MKNLLVFICFFISIQLFAQDRMTPALKTYEALLNKTVELKNNGANGVYADINERKGSILFLYKYVAAQNDAMSDDEYTESLGFTIIPDKTGKFVLKGDAVKQAMGYSYKGCFCLDRGYAAFTDGTITGVKLSKTTWYITIDVKIKAKQGDTEQLVSKKLKGKFSIVSK